VIVPLDSASLNSFIPAKGGLKANLIDRLVSFAKNSVGLDTYQTTHHQTPNNFTQNMPTQRYVGLFFVMSFCHHFTKTCQHSAMLACFLSCRSICHTGCTPLYMYLAACMCLVRTCSHSSSYVFNSFNDVVCIAEVTSLRRVLPVLCMYNQHRDVSSLFGQFCGGRHAAREAFGPPKVGQR
jgi:hypothetical protein